jgi:hypothetical protein
MGADTQHNSLHNTLLAGEDHQAVGCRHQRTQPGTEIYLSQVLLSQLQADSVAILQLCASTAHLHSLGSW